MGKPVMGSVSIRRVVMEITFKSMMARGCNAWKEFFLFAWFLRKNWYKRYRRVKFERERVGRQLEHNSLYVALSFLLGVHCLAIRSILSFTMYWILLILLCTR